MRAIHRLSLLLLLCGGWPVVATAIDHTVLVGPGETYNPSTVTINVGDRVVFRNQGGLHNVAEDNGLFRCAQDCQGVNGGTGNPSSNAWVFGVQLNATGTLNYHCDTHPNQRGTIIVQQAGGGGNVQITPGFTGAWYDPQQSGHGLFLEVLPDGRLLAWWFTFGTDGRQVWFGGTGPIQGNRAVVTADQTLGGRWIPNFNPAQVTNLRWGTLTFTFTSCTSGRVEFSSNLAEFGAGAMQLTRLTAPAGVNCP
jgi:plastocyanin